MQITICQLDFATEYNLQEWLQLDHVINQSEDEWKQTAAGFIKDLLSGLCHLHTQEPKIIHRDLKVGIIVILNTDCLNGQVCRLYVLNPLKHQSSENILRVCDFENII